MSAMNLIIRPEVQGTFWRSGDRFISEPSYWTSELSKKEKDEILEAYAEFLAKRMVRELRMDIIIQYRSGRWAPLSDSYKRYKELHGLSTDIWHATGKLLDSIMYYKQWGRYYVGIHPNSKYDDGTSVLFVATCMEFGTKNIPARPLFRPVVSRMRRNARLLWEEFLEGEVRR